MHARAKAVVVPAMPAIVATTAASAVNVFFMHPPKCVPGGGAGTRRCSVFGVSSVGAHRAARALKLQPGPPPSRTLRQRACAEHPLKRGVAPAVSFPPSAEQGSQAVALPAKQPVQGLRQLALFVAPAGATATTSRVLSAKTAYQLLDLLLGACEFLGGWIGLVACQVLSVDFL